MVLGRRPPVGAGSCRAATAQPPAQNYTFCRPTDVAWDPQGNIFVSDGYCNNRVVKYDKDGHFLAKVGSAKPARAWTNSTCRMPCRWTAGNVYVADRGNNRYQVLDNNLNCEETYTIWARPGPFAFPPGRISIVFMSNSNPNGNPPGSWD